MTDYEIDTQRYVKHLRERLNDEFPNPTPEAKTWLEKQIVLKTKEYMKNARPRYEFIASTIWEHLREPQDQIAPEIQAFAPNR
jgi:hypothetical protein